MRIISKTNRAILLEMIRTDFKLRYQGSVLGYLWSLLRPLMLTTVLYIVFVKFLRIGGDMKNYAAYLLLGIMCWTFFIEVTTGGVGAVVSKGDLIRKISIPRYLTVISSSASAMINFLLNFIVLIFIMIFTGINLKTNLLGLIPILMIQLYLFSLSIAFILSATYVKFRDVSFIWEVITQLLFYLTPIIYPVSLILNRYNFVKYILFNPLAQIIQDIRYILVDSNQTTTIWSEFKYFGLISLIITVFLLYISILFFKNQSKDFAENV